MSLTPLQEVLQECIPDYMGLTHLKDYHPRVTVAHEYRTYYSISTGEKTYHLKTKRDAENVLLGVQGSLSPFSQQYTYSVSYGVQEHEGTIPVYRLTEYRERPDTPSAEHSVIDASILQEMMQSSYHTLRLKEYNLAQMMGFQSMYEALQHDHVQDMLQHYTVFEVLRLKETQLYQRIREAYNVVLYDLMRNDLPLDAAMEDAEDYFEQNKREIEKRQLTTFRTVFSEVYHVVQHMSGASLDYPMSWILNVIEELQDDLEKFAIRDVSTARHELL